MTLYVSTSGNDANPGTASLPLKTLQRAVNLGYSLSGNVAIDGMGCTYQEPLKVYYAFNGLIIISNCTMKPVPQNWCATVGDGGILILDTVQLDASGVVLRDAYGTPVLVNGAQVPVGCGFVAGHQNGVVDICSGCSIIGSVTEAAFGADYQTHFNIMNGLAVKGGHHPFPFKAGPGSTWNINGPFVATGNPTFSRFGWWRAAHGDVQGNVSFSGSWTGSPALVNQNGILLNMSGYALPGGTPQVASGGRYLTDIAA